MHKLFFALMLMGQIAAPLADPVLVQQPYMCGAQYATRPLRVLVIGNSLAWSPPQPAFNWAQSNGMAASSLETDYAHVICRALAERRRQSVALMVVQGWEIEKAVNTAQPVRAEYAEIINRFAPDVLVTQFSDNVSLANAERFSAVYGEFLGTVKWQQSLICLSVWYADHVAFNAGIRDNCTIHGGTFVEIGDIYTAPDMRGSSFDTEINAGVGSHPNDLGMFEIARRVVLALE